jgi:hypothetical protein
MLAINAPSLDEESIESSHTIYSGSNVLVNRTSWSLIRM